MEFFRKHDKLAKVIVAVASLGLVASSLLPLFALK